jgi:hypothetical protein
MRSFSSPEQAAASPSSNRTRPSSTRSGHDQQAAEERQRLELDVRVAEPSPDRDRLAQQGLADLRVRFREGPDELHPAVLGPVGAGLLEHGAGARQPAVADRPVAEDVAGDPGGGHRRPAGGGRVALPPVGGVGALAVRRGGGVLPFQVQRLGEPFQHLAGLGALGQGELERAAGGGGVAVAQGGRALVDHGGAHLPMMA